MKKQSSPYTCVSCDFYDVLEIFAMRKNQVKIIFTNEEGAENIIITKIITLKTLNKQEFIITLSELEIRLDRIVDVTKYDG